MKTMIENVKKIALMLTFVFGISAVIIAGPKTPIKVTDLQKSITDQIAKDYAGYTIKNAYKMNSNKVITYDVNVVKGTQSLCLAFDQSGKFLKVVEPTIKSNNKTTVNTSQNHAQKPQK